MGAGGRERVAALGREARVELVATPRHATVLLVAGRVPGRFREELRRVHDQVPLPRATVLWGDGPDPAPSGSEPAPVGIAADAGPAEAAAALQRLHRALLLGEREAEPCWLPDEPPAPWRGRGDHGQGGDGMMGGKPYGRPMAMTGDDLRDGLALDRLELRLGPFFRPFPPGLVLEVVLQGDLVQEADVVSPPFEQTAAPGDRGWMDRLPELLPGLEWGEAVRALAALARGGADPP